MTHIMLDAYGADDTALNDMRAIYEFINKFTNAFHLDTIMPPVVVPYYYGSCADDDGISAFVLLRGGHFTIHSFPFRECYFVDVLCPGFISQTKFEAFMKGELPFANANTNFVDRRFAEGNNVAIDEHADFGPHYMIKTTMRNPLDMDAISYLLDQLPHRIDMLPIMRPIVVRDSLTDPHWLSGITVIAQSHIALHYDIDTQEVYLDIFSCSFIHCNQLHEVIQSMLGQSYDSVLISRGSKHASREAQREQIIERHSSWLSNIVNKE